MCSADGMDVHRPISRSLAMASALLVFLAACSGDEGAPTTGPGSGTGTGGGTAGGSSGGGGETSTASSSEAGAKKPSAEGPCADGAECVSGVCFVGTSQSYCSVTCTVATAASDCAAPFTGSCNKQGFCKRD